MDSTSIKEFLKSPGLVFLWMVLVFVGCIFILIVVTAILLIVGAF